MSSPIAKESYSKADKALIRVHQRASHGRRTNLLAERIGHAILNAKPHATCLDVGCGDMTITRCLRDRLPGSKIFGLDLYPAERLQAKGLSWDDYIQFDGQKIPFDDQTIDCLIFCDVLHHMPIDIRGAMLLEAARVAKKVIVKDHFEYGFFSRTMLRLMDFVGNWAYGVSVPKRYFSTTEFETLIGNAGLTVEKIDVGIGLYDHLPIIRNILRPKWQFISILRPTSK